MKNENVENPALRQVSIDGLKSIGHGAMGEVYCLNDDTIVKVFNKRIPFAVIEREMLFSKEAFLMGMPTARPFDMVRVGSQYGLVYERLYGPSLSANLVSNPQQEELYARQLASLMHRLHAVELPATTTLPNVIDYEESLVRRLSRHFAPANVDLLLRILTSIPSGHRLLHCDLQPKNVIIQNDEMMLIDMGEVSYGHPLSDLAHSHNAMMNMPSILCKGVIGIPKEQSQRFWLRTLDYYFENEPRDIAAHRIEQISVASIVRRISWLALPDKIPSLFVKLVVALFQRRLAKQKDYMIDVCKTFEDWAL